MNNIEKPKTIICDLDGTLCLETGRGPYEFEKCYTDRPNPVVVSILEHLSGCISHVIFITGRDDSVEDMTVEWLNKYTNVLFRLFMRVTGDKRQDAIVKKELFENHVKDKYEVLFVLDDRNRVVDMWREQGLVCLQVAEGDY